MNKKLVIVGAGGHARVVLDTALLLNHRIHGILDLQFNESGEYILGIPVIGGTELLKQLNPDEFMIAIAIGDNHSRANWHDKVQSHGFELCTLIHPTANLSEQEMKIEPGVFINAGAVINACVSIGTGTIINTGAIIDHECEIGKFVHVAPGCSIAGRVKIGDSSFIGIGAAIIDKITIGSRAIIGANSTISKAVNEGEKVVGINKRVG